MPSGNRTLTPTPLPTGEGLKRRASLGRSRSDFMTTIASNGYQSGFGNEFATEAVPGTLPQGRNSPQKVAHGLYRSEEHTSELQSLMRISYAVSCLQKKKNTKCETDTQS